MIEIRINKIPTEENPSDMTTKVVPAPLLGYYLNLVRIVRT